jgi:hypothetical protein
MCYLIRLPMNLHLPLLLLLVFVAGGLGAPPEPRVAIQPLGKGPADVVAVIRAKLGALYRVKVTPRCMMSDAGGKVKVVDDSTGELCPACREKLGELATGR